MAFTVEFLPSAVRQIESLPRGAGRQVVDAVAALADDPRPPGSRRLVGIPEGVSRLRVGDYRVTYQVKDERLLVLVVRVADRREAYAQRALERLRMHLRREGE